MRINVDFEGITAAVIAVEESVRIDPGIRKYANQQLARYCEKFVPASSAKMLAQPVAITSEYVQYRGPYGHYQHAGIVYGPNIPIMEGGTVTGWFSPPNKPKTKTDRKLKYSHDVHPLAQDHWEEAAMLRHEDDLCEDVGKYIERRYNDGR